MIGNKYILYRCGRCGAQMRLVPGKYSFYYRCEKYDFAYRSMEDRVCTNRISLRQCSRIEDRIAAWQKQDRDFTELDFELDDDKQYYVVHADNRDPDLIYVTVERKERGTEHERNDF